MLDSKGNTFKTDSGCRSTKIHFQSRSATPGFSAALILMTNHNPTVSIILPTYNRAKFLPQAFGSIRSQTWTDWELIIVDDGSTDETPEFLKELTANFQQPVRYICQENQGAYGARNTGLDHAIGKYIAFFDSDDLWLPH